MSLFDRKPKADSPRVMYSIVGDDEGANVTVFIAGRSPLVAHSSHPNYADIITGATNGDPDVADLFDLAATAASKFERLSDRVTTAHGRLYLDGDEIANVLTGQVLRFLDEGREDWRPLVKFFEAVQGNPSAHSREQLYAWLEGEEFAITAEGDIIGYKGVRKGDGGELVSIHAGRAIVNGVVAEGNIPNGLGDVVEMPRGDVTFDPSEGCSRGLHVGTYSYANNWAQGALLEVHVNPRDVVSVPTDCAAAKMRVCRYRVVKLIDAPYTTAVVYGDEYGDEYGDDWGERDPDGDDWAY